MHTNRQMILPGIPEIESLQTKEISSKLRFGIEIECGNFYNGKPIKGKVFSRIKNRQTGVIYEAKFEMERTKNNGKWIDKVLNILSLQVDD